MKVTRGNHLAQCLAHCELSVLVAVVIITLISRITFTATGFQGQPVNPQLLEQKVSKHWELSQHLTKQEEQQS